jgi:hypothetical protein
LLGAFLVVVGILVAPPQWLGIDVCHDEPSSLVTCGSEPLDAPLGLLVCGTGVVCLAAAARVMHRGRRKKAGLR